MSVRVARLGLVSWRAIRNQPVRDGVRSFIYVLRSSPAGHLRTKGTREDVIMIREIGAVDRNPSISISRAHCGADIEFVHIRQARLAIVRAGTIESAGKHDLVRGDIGSLSQASRGEQSRIGFRIGRLSIISRWPFLIPAGLPIGLSR